LLFLSEYQFGEVGATPTLSRNGKVRSQDTLISSRLAEIIHLTLIRERRCIYTKNKQITIIGGLLICAGIAFSGLYWQGLSNTTLSPTPSINPTVSTNESDQFNEIRYTGIDGQTALALLKTKYPDIQTKKSDFGEYVDSINDIAGGTDGKYWLFYINGQMASVGADAYVTKDGDVIQWRFE